MISGLLKRFFGTKEFKSYLKDVEDFGTLIVEDLLAIARKQDPDSFLSDTAFIFSNAILTMHDTGLGHLIKNNSIAVRAIAVDQSGAEAANLIPVMTRGILEKLMMAGKTATKPAVFLMLIDPDFKG